MKLLAVGLFAPRERTLLCGHPNTSQVGGSLEELDHLGGERGGSGAKVRLQRSANVGGEQP